MRGDSTSRALRSLAGELATLDEDDLRAILDAFDADARARLMDLIESFRRGETLVSAMPPPTDGLSDWLAQRLNEALPPHSGMTEHAAAALHTAAAKAGPGTARRPHPSGSTGGWLAGLRLRP